MKHVLSATQFSKSDLFHILSRAKEMETIVKKGGIEVARGKILGALFYEPSTRTRLSFETAMLRLGGSVISETDVAVSSATKGESLEDSIRIVAGYSDVIALRSQKAGDADRAAQASSVPILNAGDGAGQHPTQSLLDLYTISKHFDLEKPLTVSFVGDLKYGRTVHSLCEILRNFSSIKLQFIAPEILQMPESSLQSGDTQETNLTADILKNSDVIYDTRIQKERFESESDYESLKKTFVFDREKVSTMKSNAILLHPLPRVNEITPEVDTLPQAQYFNQAINGVPVRMVLIAEALGL